MLWNEGVTRFVACYLEGWKLSFPERQWMKKAGPGRAGHRRMELNYGYGTRSHQLT